MPKASRQSAVLTSADRFAYQRAIEEVYWRHRIWPKERPDSKPSLDEVMSSAEVEEKVQQYLRDSQWLADYGHMPLAAEQLQGEIDRMIKHTKDPEVLREIFEALGNDRFVIAECLARPVLAERLINSSYAGDATLKQQFESLAARGKSQMPLAAPAPKAGYTRATTTYAVNDGCVDDTWNPTSTANAPAGRAGHTAIWTGSEMIVWGGTVCGATCAGMNTGGRYNPATDTWTSTSTTNVPAGRSDHTAVWTGTQMIVWGGYNEGSDTYFNTGGKYNPSTNSWTATSTVNAPGPRSNHTAVWTGSEMIVWGGVFYNGSSSQYVSTGGMYNPTTNTWTATTLTNSPAPRAYHTAVWSGSEMIVWGGEIVAGTTLQYLNTGARYNPGSNSWAATNTTNAPAPESSHTAVWTGSEMIVWGGQNENGVSAAGGRYNPGSNSWTATSTTNAPAARSKHTVIWTGSEMIIWGGNYGGLTGGRYHPGGDSWTAISTTDAQTDGPAVWTGNRMIVWGGDGSSTGGRYCVKTGVTAAGSTLEAENCPPPNGVIDPGENVTVSFCVRNSATQNTTNLVGTLEATGGVANPSGPQTYGVVTPGGPAVCRSFTFTANGNCGDLITATIQLQDGATSLGTATYTFTLGVRQNLLNEGFNSIANDFPGWIMQNNSQPAGTTGWFQGASTVFPSRAGGADSYVAANFNNTTGTSTISNWLLTPALTLQNGVRLTFYTRTVDNPVHPDRLQVRMSLNGSSSDVGSTATSVGDFTALLLDINPAYTTSGYPSRWTQYTVTLSGIASPTTGRLAFRYFVESGGPTGARSDYIGIDSVSIDNYTCCGPGTLMPLSAVSRKTHGGTTDFDIDLPLYGNPGIECRDGSTYDDYQIVVNFANPVTVNGNPQAEVISGSGFVGHGGVSYNGGVTINGNTVIISLTRVTHAETIKVRLNGVVSGGSTGSMVIPMSVLVGDTTGDGLVNSADISQAKSQSGTALTNSNFREDINGDGFINSADISLVKSKSGTGLP